MQNQYYESYKLNQIVKVSKIVKNHIFYKVVPSTLLYKYSLKTGLFMDGNLEDETFYKINFNLVDNEKEEKLTIKQFNNVFVDLDLSRIRTKKNKDISDDDLINNVNIYYNKLVMFKILDDKIYFENLKEVHLYVLLYKFIVSFFYGEGNNYRDITNIKAENMAIEYKTAIKNFLFDNSEFVDINKILNVIEKIHLVLNGTFINKEKILKEFI